MYSQYKKSFIVALSLHLILFIILCVRFDFSSRYTANYSEGNIIQAEAVLPNQVFSRNSYKQITPPVVEQQAKAIPKPEKTTDLDVWQIKKQNDLKKKMLMAMQKEMLSEAKKMQSTKQKDLLRSAMEKELQMEREAMQGQVGAGARGLRGQPGAVGEVDKYKAAILQTIASNWIVTDGVANNATCLLLVNVAPGGVVIDVKLLKSSGNSVLDRSAEAAVLKSSPLPVPTDAALFDSFRTIKLTVKPEGIY